MEVYIYFGKYNVEKEMSSKRYSPFLSSVDIRNAGSALKFGKCVPVRLYQLVDEYAVILKHFTSSTYILHFAFLAHATK
jgi:hypothetical protein